MTEVVWLKLLHQGSTVKAPGARVKFKMAESSSIVAKLNEQLEDMMLDLAEPVSERLDTISLVGSVSRASVSSRSGHSDEYIQRQIKVDAQRAKLK